MSSAAPLISCTSQKASTANWKFLLIGSVPAFHLVNVGCVPVQLNDVLRMQDAVRRYSDEIRRAQDMEVQIRVGINSGDVVVRAIGSDLRMDYTAVGLA
jgi:N-acetylglutamate synthase/N-acetylornithine aminotransferase